MQPDLGWIDLKLPIFSWVSPQANGILFVHWRRNRILECWDFIASNFQHLTPEGRRCTNNRHRVFTHQFEKRKISGQELLTMLHWTNGSVQTKNERKENSKKLRNLKRTWGKEVCPACFAEQEKKTTVEMEKKNVKAWHLLELGTLVLPAFLFELACLEALHNLNKTSISTM